MEVGRLRNSNAFAHLPTWGQERIQTKEKVPWRGIAACYDAYQRSRYLLCTVDKAISLCMDCFSKRHPNAQVYHPNAQV